MEIKSYTLSQMVPGLTESFTVTVTEEKMAQFCAMSGDISPIHMDPDYAAQRGYADGVCYGMLVASFFSTLAGVFAAGRTLPAAFGGEQICKSRSLSGTP